MIHVYYLIGFQGLFQGTKLEQQSAGSVKLSTIIFSIHLTDIIIIPRRKFCEYVPERWLLTMVHGLWLHERLAGGLVDSSQSNDGFSMSFKHLTSLFCTPKSQDLEHYGRERKHRQIPLFRHIIGGRKNQDMSRSYRQPFWREPIGTAIFLKTRRGNERLFSAQTMTLRNHFPFSLVVRHAHRGPRLVTPSTFFRTLWNWQLY